MITDNTNNQLQIIALTKIEQYMSILLSLLFIRSCELLGTRRQGVSNDPQQLL